MDPFIAKESQGTRTRRVPQGVHGAPRDGPRQAPGFPGVNAQSIRLMPWMKFDSR